ncbi:hypothetical protein [Lentzea terrae]|uniref:hypothetical protein n=1 Tax=Lentzea terrae TaxID=2200761 RepID=UPI000DD3BD1D|nr:hypothetical protein [Lentzea terrae]
MAITRQGEGETERVGAPARERTHRAAPALPGGPRGRLLALQRSAGNAAVQRLLEPAAPAPAADQEAPTGESAELPESVTGQAAAIDADTQTSITTVRTASQARRTELAAQEAQAGQGVDAGFGGAVGRVGAAVDGAIGQVAGWLRGTAGSVVGTVTGLAAGTAGLVAGTAARMRSGAAAARSTVNNTVGRVASGVLSFARALPIPNLPGVGRLRTWVLGAAERVAGRVRSVVSQVTGFLSSIVSETAGLVEQVARTAQGAIRRVGDAIRSMVERGIDAISGALRRVVRGVTSALRSAWMSAKSAVRKLFGESAGHVTAVERGAVARIEANRADGLANLDVGGDPATDVEEVAHVSAENSATVAQAAAAQGGILAATRASASDYANRLREGIAAVGQKVGSIAADVFAKVREAVTAVVRQALDVVRGYATKVGQALRDIASTVLDLVRAPVTALADAGRSVVDGARSLLRSVAGRIREFLTGGGGGQNDTAVTAPLEGFTTARLRSAARMASPPAAAAAIAIPIAAGVSIATVLWWLGIVLLVIAVIVLLYLLIKEIAKAKPKPVPRERERERARRRRKRSKKPFRWNLRFLGGILDWNGKLGRGGHPIHGHHSWPKYVGGAFDQPLMNVRHDIHLHVIHPELHVDIAAFAAAKKFVVVPNAVAVAFIAHLRANPGDKAQFAAAMTAYYLLLHTQTDPGIPPSAYGAGIADSAAKLI